MRDTQEWGVRYKGNSGVRAAHWCVAHWPSRGGVKVCRERAFNGDTAMSPLDRRLSLYRVSLAE